MHYRLNDKDVVSELLDGEVIAIHLHSGTYYSMPGTGAYIWNALLGGWTETEITDRLVATGGDRERISLDIARFVSDLAAESLIIPVDGKANPRHGAFPAYSAYATPELQKYTDMQELLLVDPIHEVTEEGWPIRAETRN